MLSGAFTGALVVYHLQPKFLKRFGVTGFHCLPFGAIYGAGLFYLGARLLQSDGRASTMSNAERKAFNESKFWK